MITGIISNLPEKYEDDYFVYAASNSIFEEEGILDLPLMKVLKRAMFKKFDSWVGEQYEEELKQRNGQ